VPVHASPLYVYLHENASEVVDDGCSVVGGYVYRGSAIPELRGAYLFGDFCSTRIVALRHCGGALIVPPTRVAGLSGVAPRLASLGEDAAGELYLVSLDGAVLRIVPE
jgi:hypothetical protein